MLTEVWLTSCGRGSWSAPTRCPTAAILSLKKTCTVDIISGRLCMMRTVNTTFFVWLRRLKKKKKKYVKTDIQIFIIIKTHFHASQQELKKSSWLNWLIPITGRCYLKHVDIRIISQNSSFNNLDVCVCVCLCVCGDCLRQGCRIVSQNITTTPKNLLPCTATYCTPHPHCVPCDSLNHSVTIGIHSICRTWFDY